VKGLLSLLLVGAACVLGGMALGVSALMREQTRHRQFRERVALVTGGYARVNTLSVMGRGNAVTAPTRQLIAAAMRLFGHDAATAGISPSRLSAIVLGSLLAAWAVAAILEIFVGSLALLVIPFAWVMFSRFVFNFFAQRRHNALYAQFPDALSMIVRAVRVGVPLGEGIRTVAREADEPTRAEFARLYDRVAIGVTLEDALREMATRNDLQEYRFFATAISLQSQTGGALSEALEGLAEVIRRRLALRARGNALAAEAKTSIMILASLPFVTGGALSVMNPSYMGRMLTDHGCEKVLAAAILMLLSGLLVMRGMIRKALS
jgi:tight adherence protein B